MQDAFFVTYEFLEKKNERYFLDYSSNLRSMTNFWVALYYVFI